VTTAKNKEFSISLILVVTLLIAVAVIYLFIFSMAKDGFGKNMERVNSQLNGDVAQRIKPVVTLQDLMGDKSTDTASAQPVAEKSAKELFDGACVACHGTGVAGAPKLGDAAAWKPRFEAAGSVDGLLKSAIAGKGAMPPNGGTTYSEAEIRRVIEFMLGEAGLIESKAAPAPAPAAPATTQDAPAQAEPSSTAAEPTTPQPDPVVNASSSQPDLVAGEKNYRAACFACHDTGAAGAPRLGDKVAWAPRIATGFDALLHSALNGKNAMPVKGGATYFADSEIANIVAFMISRGQ
jgi:cytochrome c5